MLLWQTKTQMLTIKPDLYKPYRNETYTYESNYGRKTLSIKNRMVHKRDALLQ